MTFVDLLRGRVRARWLLARALALMVPLLAVSGSSVAGQVKLVWDAVANATGYRLHYGTSSGNYSSSIDAQSQTSVTVSGLTDGARYYFAVRAYNGTTTSSFSNEVSAVLPLPAPVASFTASPTTGAAPLVVTLTDRSTGSITSRSWNLGDGTTATTQAVAKTYSNPGTYTVTLTVTGSGGSTTATQLISVTAAPVAASPPPPTAPSSGGGTTGTPSTGGTAGAPAPSGSGGTTTTIGPVPAPSGGTGGSVTTGGTALYINGLVAAHGFEERGGSQVIDASGNANHGRISGAKRVTTAFFGQALKFDGRNDWITIDDSPSLGLTKGMTLEAWVYPTGPSRPWTTTVLMKERSNGGVYSLLANSDSDTPSNTINVGGPDQQLNAGSRLPKNVWTHIAATYDGTSQKLYVNGALIGSRPQTGSIVVSQGKLRIGGNSIWNDEYFTGYVDEVRIYNRALKQAEIVADSKSAVVGLLLSKSPDRSDAVPLNGLPVSGTIYVYYAQINPAIASNPVRQVAYWFDDPNPTYPSATPRRIEFRKPFDFAGTVESGMAAGFDTTGLGKGIHTITAQPTLGDGTVLPLINGTFRID